MILYDLIEFTQNILEAYFVLRSILPRRLVIKDTNGQRQNRADGSSRRRGGLFT
ncbi:hypothetical protein BDW66DRAFT_132047 [Aspergillus desertorum]